MAAYITFIVGDKGSGKSLLESRTAMYLFHQYRETEKKYPKLKHRIYFSKQKFTKKVEERELITEKNPDGHLMYWSKLDDLQFCPRLNCWRGEKPHPIHNTDVAWDEIGNDLPPDGWNDNPDYVRQMFSHCRKRGNRIYANAQKYEMTDVHFRRQVDRCWKVAKLFGSRDIDVTRPDPRFVFVIQIIREFDPADMENESDERNLNELQLGFPRFNFYTKKDVEVYDTHFELPPMTSRWMKEEIWSCIEGDNCQDPKHRHKVVHVKV